MEGLGCRARWGAGECGADGDKAGKAGEPGETGRRDRREGTGSRAGVGSRDRTGEQGRSGEKGAELLGCRIGPGRAGEQSWWMWGEEQLGSRSRQSLGAGLVGRRTVGIQGCWEAEAGRVGEQGRWGAELLGNRADKGAGLIRERG